MMLQIIEWMLGSAGRAFLEFIKVNIWLFNGLALLFLLTLGLSKWQLKQLVGRTEAMVRTSVAQSGTLVDAATLHAALLPEWEAQVTGWVCFIPHRLEFYPVPATLANIRAKFNLTPAWLEEFLSREGLLPTASTNTKPQSVKKGKKHARKKI